jgi:hypothetical protein
MADQLLRLAGVAFCTFCDAMLVVLKAYAFRGRYRVADRLRHSTAPALA